ncbi:MAG TPA: hypothetical protein VL287_10895 [Gemmatimonadales bacterium]|jgi:hypothetical protein|nr:hypothetical protein [Gemmatimonadales bacterium]
MATTGKLTESTLRFRYTQMMQERRSYLRQLEICDERLADLKTRAHEAGLAKLHRELENPPVAPPRVEEPPLRARVLESFSGEWRGMPYDAPAGTVADLPASYVTHATTLFERVDPSTPLFRPALAAP